MGQIKTNTDTMVALTTELSAGLDRAQDFLHRLSADTSGGAGRRFYLPEEGAPTPGSLPRSAAAHLTGRPAARAPVMVVWAA